MFLDSSLIGLCFAVTPYIKKEILQLISKEEMFLYSNLLSILFLFYKKNIIVEKLECKSILLLFLISFISYYYNYALNDLLSKFDPSKVMILIKSFETLFLFVFSVKNHTLKNVISVIIILTGSYIYNL